MKQRHKSREVALQILYRYEVGLQDGTSPPDGSRLADDLRKHFDHFQTPEQGREFSAELVTGTIREVAEIDAIIEKHAINWKISRMALIDRCLLRVSIYELIHFKDIPPSVTIDEAVELAKQFGEAETAPFINGILDAVAREYRPGETKRTENS